MPRLCISESCRPCVRERGASLNLLHQTFDELCNLRPQLQTNHRRPSFRSSFPLRRVTVQCGTRKPPASAVPDPGDIDRL